MGIEKLNTFFGDWVGNQNAFWHNDWSGNAPMALTQELALEKCSLL
jgi:hypothetical protein